MRNAIRWTWLLVAVAVVYSGSIMFNRWRQNRAIAQASAEKRLESDRKILDLYGSGEPRILSFYANPGILKRGETGLLCYGVINVKSVKIEPATEEVGPSLGRCIEIKPLANTRYELFAGNPDGKGVKQSLEVQVR